MYSIVGVLALVIHVIVNPSLFRRSGANGRKSGAYFFLMLAIFAYYVTDAFWGLFAGLNNIPLLFVDTTIYYVAMASALACWSSYIIEYLELDSFTSKAVKYVAWTFFYAEITALAVNFFYPCFFWFDENDAYQAGAIRHAALWIQVVLFFFTVLVTGQKALHVKGIVRSRHLAIFFFSTVMMLANFFQALYPLLPVYAMGCLIGCCILHVYVVEDEREEYRKIIAEEKNSAEAANRAKTAFLFSMSHDIRTPMNAILGYVAMARKKSADPVVTDYLKKVDIAGNQLLALVNQVLEMSRIESGSIVLQEQKINVEEGAEVVRAVYRAQARAKGISLDVEFRGVTHKHLIGDADCISRITNNLVGNAIKYTREGGSICSCVEEEPCEKPGFVISRLTVEDTGIGISEEYLPHIFEEFSREDTSTVSHIQGSGLGMSIVKRLVDLMGGTIEVTSKLGAGSKFVVRVPLKIDTEFKEEEAAGEAALQDVSLKGMKILLVEDNEMNREIAMDILGDTGAEIDVAEDGVVAVEKVANSAPGRYDVILMDVQMPRMDGYEATRRIRALADKERASVKIFAMTANAFAEDKQNALDAGMDGHLAKPIDVPKLLATLSGLKK